MRWTIKLVVTPSTCKYTQVAVSALNACGFQEDDVEVIATRGTPLSVDDSQVSKKKLKRADLIGCKPTAIQSQLFAEAIIGQSNSLISNTDIVLVMTPNILLWHAFKRFMEATIEEKYMAVYFPYTPSRFFLVNDRPMPTFTHGWYKFLCDEPVSGSVCLCMNSHTAVLLGSIIRQDLVSDAASWATISWEYQLSQMLFRSKVDCYGAGVPFAYEAGNEDDLSRVVPLDRGLKSGFERRNWYLN